MQTTEAHDPTASATTFPEHPAPLTRLSRNEVESLCLKAARGAGLPWGLTEEAGFAAGWLASRGADGPAVLLAHLTARPEVSDAIAIRDRVWSALKGGSLCPIALGAALDDHTGLEGGISAGPVTVVKLRYPGLAVPHLARIARALNAALEVTWNGEAALISAEGEMDPDKLNALLDVNETSLVAARYGADNPPLSISITNHIAPLSAHTLAGLNALSMRTTVPASELSRRGAGASASDND